MKWMKALLFTTAWLIGAGFAVAQTETTPSHEPKAPKNTRTHHQRYADCLAKASNRPTQTQKCEEKYTAANAKESQKAEHAQANEERMKEKLKMKEERERMRQLERSRVK